MLPTLPLALRGWGRSALLVGALGLAAPLGAAAQQAYWANNSELPAGAERFTQALRAYRPVAFRLPALRAALANAPAENSPLAGRNSPVVLTLPTPEGGVAHYRVTQALVMHPDLAAKYPEIQTYQGVGVEDPTAIARFDVSPAGFHAMVLGEQGRFFIDPALRFGDDVHHLVFRSQDRIMPAFRCEPDPSGTATPGVPALGTGQMAQMRLRNGAQLKTYRLALANSYEYATAVGGTAARVAAAKATSMNRINGVYVKEFSARFVLVANNNLLDFVRGGANAPNPVYTDASGPQMLNQNQTNIDRVIGNGNYDMGHVFSTGGGGIAQRPSLCVGGKARGVTGSPQPVGDAFDIDFVAHEMGHQFGCNHTFNSGAAGNCDSNTRAVSAAYEPGSGVTIMGYAGICSPEDIANNSIDIFHSISFDEAIAHLNGAGNCGVVTPSGNTPPVALSSATVNIPRGTPFALTGVATDADADPLTYLWEQFDRNSTPTPLNAPAGNAPIFRDFLPSTSPTRYFPRLSTLASGVADVGERLPTYARTMNFRFVARDGRGGVDYNSTLTQVVVSATTGPFLVTNPNVATIVWQAGAPASVNWDVAGTTGAPINTANVDILLSTDGGQTYPITLLTSTPNDGSQSITVPLTTPATTAARVMVRANGNAFFDVSDRNFRIEGNNGPTFFLNPAATSTTLAVCPGASVSTSLAIGQILGFTGTVALSSSNLPAGITVSYASASVAAGASTNATIAVAAGTAAGTYNLTLVGTSGAVTHTQVLPVLVQSAATGTAAALSPSTQARATLRPRFTWSAVPNASSYELQVSSSATFATTLLSLTGLTGTSYQPATPLAANGTYYWRVRAVSACASAPFSAVQSFQTGTEVCAAVASLQVPRTISNSGAVLINSSVNIPITSRVGEVRLILDLTHQDLSEVEITLTNPAGRSVVVLPAGTCAGGTAFNATLSDLATTAFSCAAVDAGGATVRPINPLSTLAGDAANGTWTLTIADNTAGNVGRLNAWSLNLCTLGEAPEAPASVLAYNVSGSNNEVVWSANGTGAVATYFEVQRSLNGTANFVTVGLNQPVTGGGTSGLYSENVPASGQYFYGVRLCNVFGCSGWVNSTEVLGARQNAQQAGVTVAPNPSTGLFQLTVDNAQRGALALRVTDALGRTVTSEQLTKTAAALQHTVDLSRLAPGVYNLHLTLPNGNVVTRLLKQ